MMQVGLGVVETGAREAAATVLYALKAGQRHLDLNDEHLVSEFDASIGLPQ